MDCLETHNRVLCLVKVNFLFSKNLSLTNLISKKQNNKSHYLEYKNKSHYLYNPLKLQTNCQAQFFNHKLVGQKYFNNKINLHKEWESHQSILRILVHLKINKFLVDLIILNLVVSLQLALDYFNKIINKFHKIYQDSYNQK